MVVAVIALLLAILLPALSAANEAGRGAVCGTNLNQVFLGSFAYCQANEQRLPWFGGNGPPAGYEWWVTQVARGMETFERGIYACPSCRPTSRCTSSTASSTWVATADPRASRATCRPACDACG